MENSFTGFLWLDVQGTGQMTRSIGRVNDPRLWLVGGGVRDYGVNSGFATRDHCLSPIGPCDPAAIGQAWEQEDRRPGPVCTLPDSGPVANWPIACWGSRKAYSDTAAVWGLWSRPDKSNTPERRSIPLLFMSEILSTRTQWINAFIKPKLYYARLMQIFTQFDLYPGRSESHNHSSLAARFWSNFYNVD